MGRSEKFDTPNLPHRKIFLCYENSCHNVIRNSEIIFFDHLFFILFKFWPRLAGIASLERTQTPLTENE